jgi:hypothetical protein
MAGSKKRKLTDTLQGKDKREDSWQESQFFVEGSLESEKSMGKFLVKDPGSPEIP